MKDKRNRDQEEPEVKDDEREEVNGRAQDPSDESVTSDAKGSGADMGDAGSTDEGTGEDDGQADMMTANPDEGTVQSQDPSQVSARIDELTRDLQRERADFENYRRRIEGEKALAREAGETGAIIKLLPVIDNIERAIGHLPDHLRDDPWAKAVSGLTRNLQQSLGRLGLEPIGADEGTSFNPDLHEAIGIDEDGEGDTEVVKEVLQAGYLYKGKPLRHAMVKVIRR